MARVIKIVKGVRNHWKKSIFAAAAVSYGINYGIERYEISKVMRRYCEDASRYGDISQAALQPFSNVLVILNPIADKKSAVSTFDDYCAPILHLAGLAIDVVKTDSEGHARRYIEELESLPDSILCAGGDGTISEVVTGLLRRKLNKNENYPAIGILPVGRTNNIATNLYNYTQKTQLEKVKGIVDATISVVRGKTDRKDVMKIELTQENEAIKPIYAVGTLEWGAFRDALNLRDRYWYFGPLREYAAFLFNGFSDSLAWNCKAKLIYTEPCHGCKNCYIKPHQKDAQSNRRWWLSFIPLFRPSTNQRIQTPDYSKVVNENCTKTAEIDVEKCSGILLATTNTSEVDVMPSDPPKIVVKLGNEVTGFEFILESWTRLKTNLFNTGAEHSVRTVEILPDIVSTDDAEKFFSIDNEAYEVKPIRVSIQPKILEFYVL